MVLYKAFTEYTWEFFPEMSQIHLYYFKYWFYLFFDNPVQFI